MGNVLSKELRNPCCDTISRLQKYAHLVPEAYKSRYIFKVEGLKVLMDHPSVPFELRADLWDFIGSLPH
jgi:hypothetical protein